MLIMHRKLRAYDLAFRMIRFPPPGPLLIRLLATQDHGFAVSEHRAYLIVYAETAKGSAKGLIKGICTAASSPCVEPNLDRACSQILPPLPLDSVQVKAGSSHSEATLSLLRGIAARGLLS